jgi:tetratricopeptide (TPR) repeat protein
MTHVPRLLIAASLVLTGGCLQKIAINAVANTLSGTTGGAFTRDSDLQFVGEAIPFALKLMESVHEATPEHVPLLDTLCSSFTQYAVVYVQWPAEQLKWQDYEAYRAGQDRARAFLNRSQRYCMASFEVDHPGFSELIQTDPKAALAEMDEDDVSRLYWTGATWLARISISKEDPFAIGELPIASAMLGRALELDEDWEAGSLHEMMVLLEPSSPMPGGLDRARKHFERAIELSGGSRAGTFVSLATAVSVSEQNREEFVALMHKALAVDASSDPENQLANLYAQEQARFYLEHTGDLFAL